MKRLKKLWKMIGPGFITGASDDDPSGITTYSIAGAKFGFGALWTALFTLPFMIAIQQMCGRIGLVSGRGIVGNLKRHYPRLLLIVMVLLVVTANTINIGANLAGMAASFTLVVPNIPTSVVSAILALVLALGVIFFSYRTIASYLKWFALAMFSYVLAAVFADLQFGDLIINGLIPHITLSKEYLLIIVAILGTTISPYLFFWEASEEVEEEAEHAHKTSRTELPHMRHRSRFVVQREILNMQRDTRFGMFFSNLIMFFIVAMAGSTLFIGGMRDVATIDQIASVLEPLAGPHAQVLFLVGIFASGLLSIPVLAGSAAYALAEVFGWKEGMSKRFAQARQFYIVVIGATILGVLMPLFGIDPVTALFYTAVIYGVITPFLIIMVVHMAQNEKVVGTFKSSPISIALALLLVVVMVASFLLMILL